MPSAVRTRLYEDFMKVLTTDVDGENKKRGFGYGPELGDAENPASNAAFVDFLNAGAITDHDGKRLPGRKGRTENDRINSIGKMLESGKPFYVYTKGEEYPREVYYDFEKNKIMVSKLTVDKMKNKKPPQPDGLDRMMAFFGNAEKKELVARWDKYTQRRTVRSNVRDEKRINRRRRNDTGLYRTIRGRAVNNSDSDTYESLMTSLKAELGYEKNFREKGNAALKDVLENGSIINSSGRRIDVPGKGTPEDMTFWLGKGMFDARMPVYIFKPGEKAPHEVYLGSDNRLIVSEKTIDKMNNEVPEPRWYHKLAHFFSGSNETVLNYARAKSRQYMLQFGYDLPKDTPLPEEKKEQPAEKQNDEPQKTAEVEKNLNGPESVNKAIEKNDIEVEAAVIQPEQPVKSAPEQPAQPESEADKLNAKYDKIFADFKAGKITQEEMNRQLEEARNPQPAEAEKKAEEKTENKPELLNATLHNEAEPVPQKEAQNGDSGLISDLLKTIESMQKQMAEMEKTMNAAILANIESQKKLEQSIDIQQKIQSDAKKENAELEAKAVEAVKAEMKAAKDAQPKVEQPKAGPKVYKAPANFDIKKVSPLTVKLFGLDKVQLETEKVNKVQSKTEEVSRIKSKTEEINKVQSKTEEVNKVQNKAEVKEAIKEVQQKVSEKKELTSQEKLLASLAKAKAKLEKFHLANNPKPEEVKNEQPKEVKFDPPKPGEYKLPADKDKQQVHDNLFGVDKAKEKKVEFDPPKPGEYKLPADKDKQQVHDNLFGPDKAKEKKVEAPEEKNGPISGSGAGVQYDPVNKCFVRFDRTGLTPKEEFLAREKIINGGREPSPEEMQIVNSAPDEELAKKNNESQMQSEEPCKLIENVVTVKGEKAVSGQLCENVFNIHSSAIESKASIEQKCAKGAMFAGGNDVKNIVINNNMKNDLSHGTINDTMLNMYSSPACISYSTEMSKVSPNMMYASKEVKSPSFYKKNILNQSGLNSLTRTYNSDINKALAMNNKKNYTKEQMFENALKGMEAIQKNAEKQKQHASSELGKELMKATGGNLNLNTKKNPQPVVNEVPENISQLA